MFKRILLAALVIPALMTLPAVADQWERIGTQQANDTRDTDTIKVQGNERHKQIRLCVEKNPLQMRDLDVVYANGNRQDVPVRSLIGAGGCTRAVDLNGNTRNIDKVVMTYDKLLPGKSPMVQVYAK